MQITLNPKIDLGITEESRLVIYDIEHKTFHSMHVIKREDTLHLDDIKVLNDPWNYKYKYQIKENGKWVDKTTYMMFYNSQELDDYILGKREIANQYRFNNLASSLITSETLRKTLYKSIPLLMRQIWDPNEKNHGNIEKLITYIIEQIGYEPTFLGNITFYLKHYLKLKKKMAQSKLALEHFISTFPGGVGDHDFLEYLEETIKECEKYRSTLQLSNVLSGKLLSYLGRREEAIQSFNNALRFEENHIAALRFDQGIYSYSELNVPVEIPDSIDMLMNENRNSEIVLVMSLDIRFLRFYGINILYTANVLKQYHFHFHIIGERNEVEACVKETIDLFRKMSVYRQNISPIKTPSFSTEEVPEGIVDPKTYYACTRFLRASFFMDYFDSDLYILDADLFITTDPGRYFSKLKEYDIALPFLKGIITIEPWRRILAGNVYLKNTHKSREFVSMVRSYILTNISKPYAWTLDQNALSYTFEHYIMNKIDIKIGNTLPFDMPFYQPLIRKEIEKL